MYVCLLLWWVEECVLSLGLGSVYTKGDKELRQDFRCVRDAITSINIVVGRAILALFAAFIFRRISLSLSPNTYRGMAAKGARG